MILKSMKGRNIRWYKFVAHFKQFKKRNEVLINYFIDCLKAGLILQCRKNTSSVFHGLNFSIGFKS